MLAEHLLRALPDGLGHHQGEQRGDGAADGEQDPLLDFEALLIGAHDRREEVHRAPFHDLEPALVEEVDEERDGERDDTRQHGGVEKIHARPSLRVR